MPAGALAELHLLKALNGRAAGFEGLLNGSMLYLQEPAELRQVGFKEFFHKIINKELKCRGERKGQCR